MSITRLQALNHGLPELVMFDLDGTLVDSVPGLALAIDRALADFDCDAAGVELVRTWVGGGQKKLVQEALAFAGLSEGQLPDALTAFRRHYRDTADHQLALFPGVQLFLDFCVEQAIPQVVVTNKPIEFVPAILESLGVSEYFGDVLGGECLPERKPHPLPLLTMLERFSVAPERALMVGDSSNDLVAAQKAGVPSLAVTYGYARGDDLLQYQPIWLGDNLSDLLAAQAQDE